MPALLQVLDEGRARLVDVAALQPHVGGQVAVMVPASLEDLDKAHVPLRQPPGQQAIRGDRPRNVHVGTVHVENMLRLVRHVGQLGDRRLHAIGHLVLRDARVDLRIADRRRAVSGSVRQAHRACGGARPNRRPEDWKDTAPGRPTSATRPPGISRAGNPIPTAAKRRPERRASSSRSNAARRTWAGCCSGFPGRTRPTPPCWAGPGRCAPVNTNVQAGSWLIASVFTVRTIARSSTIFARCGNNSLTQAPPCPCRSNLKTDGAIGSRF